jgi:hypothetical protein
MEQLSEIQQINRAIMFGNLTNDELNSITDAIKFVRANIAKRNKCALRVGDAVKFRNSRTGGMTLGTVKKINIKYILVNEKSNGSLVSSTWRVPANMLEAV